ncbi:MAG TPA: hypothetical protein VLG92_03005 [Candidatus Saccharimonadia bacterium]|nr:hypothetical protein [Candidatus Saccharimonadia bacterium]
MAFADIIQFGRSAVTCMLPTRVEMTIVQRPSDDGTMTTDFAFVNHELLAERELPTDHPHVNYQLGEPTEVEAYAYNERHNPEVSPYRLTVQNCDAVLSVAETVNGAAMEAVLSRIAGNKNRRRALQATAQDPDQSTTLRVNLKTVRALGSLMAADMMRTAGTTPDEATATAII